MPTELKIPQELDFSAFVSKEAHDLKSPFNRALGFLKLVLKGMDGPISEQAREDLTVAYQNTQYTLLLMNALVDMARLGRGERSMTPEAHAVDYILQKTVSDWQRKYHKESPVEITFSAPEVEIQVDEIVFRQGLARWIWYVVEFVQTDAKVDIQVEAQSDHYLFTIRSDGEKRQPPPECDLTMHGYIAQKTLDLHGGELLRLEEHDTGALAQFSLPMSV